MSAPTIPPKAGQVWADNDPRSAGRTILIERVLPRAAELTDTGDYVVAEVLAPAHLHGRKTHIRASRLRPTQTGYRLLGEIWALTARAQKDGDYGLPHVKKGDSVVSWSARTPGDPTEARRRGGMGRSGAALWLLEQDALR